ncbi:acyl-CoA thioesterase [Halorarum salinum]|uniref:Acyl-[acyl-carrier-protein] thioesterase n=1 Tax=Halorarum salinum TaxID=2743089 RepID=A0A7D5QIW4_9EURY|nr:acyl-[acyl-carrier-protein] thioesterase [Halobaculum salinum]QLG63903.1 acyl-[acyl-carrier-protein] thioesterase [Halobaculum salinum]
MGELLRHKVRFGELSYGPLLHNATFFDLLIEATEELSYELGYTVEEIVEAGGVPYAPVAIHADVSRYPRYEDTIVVDVEPVSIGENHVQFAYRFERASDGAEFGHATMVQVTITPDGAAEPITPALRDELESLGSADRRPVEIDPRPVEGDGPQFARDVTFRTPLLEAANLGYFEDYARELSITLETFLEDRGRSLRSLTDGAYPFVPVGWDMTLENSIRFEDEIAIVGRVLDADEDAIDVAYELRRESTDDVCIRADLSYGCFDGDGERVPFPAEAVELVGSG